MTEPIARLIGYLSVTDAARRKRVNPNTITRVISRGQLDAVTIAGRLLVVDNTTFRTWEPDRTRQQAILDGIARWKASRP
jgi:hypothetical protein